MHLGAGRGGAGRGCAPLRSPVRAGDPTGEETSRRAAGPWRGRGCLSPGGARRCRPPRGPLGRSPPAPALPQLPRSHQRPRRGRESSRRLPVLPHPRRYPRQGGLTVRSIPALQGSATRPLPGLYLPCRGSPGQPPGLAPAPASRVLLAGVL